MWLRVFWPPSKSLRCEEAENGGRGQGRVYYIGMINTDSLLAILSCKVTRLAFLPQ